MQAWIAPWPQKAPFMQMMSWMLSRLGSRFSLFFEPYKRRVMHSALGRFMDAPLDLMVGSVDPDGVERAFPFTTRGQTLYNQEQFERFNSITFRGYSEHYGLRVEFNVHSVFYPQEEELCLMPAFYLEVRVNPVDRVRGIQPLGPTPNRVKLFFRIQRPDTVIKPVATPDPVPGVFGYGPGIEMEYRNTLSPRLDDDGLPLGVSPLPPGNKTVLVRERIVSMNADAVHDADGQGMTLEIPVTEIGSGVKWRLVWGAFCAEPVVRVHEDGEKIPGKFRYTKYWDSLDSVMDSAINMRDERLAQSRRLEKIAEQAPLRNAERHLVHLGFQSFLANTFWCDMEDTGNPLQQLQWFSVADGSSFFHSVMGVEYEASLFYLSIWPQLIELQLPRWVKNTLAHGPSGGAIMKHDLGRGLEIAGSAYPYHMPVEDGANFLLVLQTHLRWSGDLTIAQRYADVVESLAKYLIWSDRDRSGFPSEGSVNSITDGTPVIQYARKQTYLAIKRLAGLSAAADLLTRAGKKEIAERCSRTIEQAAPRIESTAWLGDHYSVCNDPADTSIAHPGTGALLQTEIVEGADAYSIYTSNGLLLPMISGMKSLLDPSHLASDTANAVRETLGPYGCGHTTKEIDSVWVSSNLWRDVIYRYHGNSALPWTPNYWELQVMSNTGQQSMGFSDTYIGNACGFSPRGIAGIGLLLGYPRLVINRFSKSGPFISVDPDLHRPQRWPLFPLADWKAGKVPVVVVDPHGRVTIEGEVDPIAIIDNKRSLK